MNKAFIFDLDGVLVDSERLGESYLIKLFDKDIRKKIGNIVGIPPNEIYNRAVMYGFSMNLEDYQALLDKLAIDVYSKATITEGLEELTEMLIANGFKLGIVSSSKQLWVDQVLSRLPFRNRFDYILADNSQIKPKPNPDGYIKAIKELGSSAQTTIILEDSNVGIKAAKRSGAFTIGFKKNLLPEYEQTGADRYANTIRDVIAIVASLNYL